MEDKIRWGILATGGASANFTEDLLRTAGAEVVAVASRSLASAKAFAERFEIPRWYGSWVGLAADNDVDIVYVATPHAVHRQAVQICFEGGKAVLCEKPLTLNVSDSRSLVDLAVAYDVFLMEGMWMRFNPAIRRMADLIHDGAIGPVRSIQADLGLAGPFDPTHRLRDPHLGGGALLDLGIYPVSLAHLLLGAPDTVSAQSQMTPEGVDSNTGLILGYGTGALAVLSCGFVSETSCTATVAGEHGRIEVPRDFIRPAFFTLIRDGREPEIIHAPWTGNGFVHEAAEAVRCVREGHQESPVMPWGATIDVLTVLDEARAQVGVRYPGEAT